MSTWESKTSVLHPDSTKPPWLTLTKKHTCSFPLTRRQDILLALQIRAPLLMPVVLVVQLVVLVPLLLCRRRFLGRHGLGGRELGGLPDPARAARHGGWVAAAASADGALPDDAAHEVGKVVGEEGSDGGDAGQGDGGAELGDGPGGDVRDVPCVRC